MDYWNESVECIDRQQLERLQLELLQSTLKRAYEQVPLYRTRFDEAGIKPEDVKSLSDLRHLPLRLSRISGTPIRLACLQCPWTT